MASAADIVSAALKHMEDRAQTYDSPRGERSMQKAVEAFNVLHGTDLTATDGWRFMAILKLVRSTQGAPRLDNWEDLAAYAGLAGEADMAGELAYQSMAEAMREAFAAPPREPPTPELDSCICWRAGVGRRVCDGGCRRAD